MRLASRPLNDARLEAIATWSHLNQGHLEQHLLRIPCMCIGSCGCVALAPALALNIAIACQAYVELMCGLGWDRSSGWCLGLDDGSLAETQLRSYLCNHVSARLPSSGPGHHPLDDMISISGAPIPSSAMSDWVGAAPPQNQKKKAARMRKFS